jgi:hypothetical protein
MKKSYHTRVRLVTAKRKARQRLLSTAMQARWARQRFDELIAVR